MIGLVELFSRLLGGPAQPDGKLPDFGTAIERVLRSEGGYVNHPSDPGGATNFGITQRVARKHGYMGDMRNLPRATAIEIYRQDYWLAGQCQELPHAVAFQHFDACVNHGPRQAALFLQRAVGVKDDGVIGPKTLAAVRSMPQAQVVARQQAARLDFYTSLSTWPTFGKGWTRRMAQNITYGGEDA